MTKVEKIREELKNLHSRQRNIEILSRYCAERGTEIETEISELKKELDTVVAQQTLNRRKLGKTSCNLYNVKKDFDLKVIEVTGKNKNGYVKPRWFELSNLNDARRYALRLEKANVWVAEACIEGNILFTGKRKRVNLNHPDAMFIE
jgi:hypothetical protein